jgi:hypothetical protein
MENYRTLSSPVNGNNVGGKGLRFHRVTQPRGTELCRYSRDGAGRLLALGYVRGRRREMIDPKDECYEPLGLSLEIRYYVILAKMD